MAFYISNPDRRAKIEECLVKLSQEYTANNEDDLIVVSKMNYLKDLLKPIPGTAVNVEEEKDEEV